MSNCKPSFWIFFKEDIGNYRGKLVGVLAIRMLLFIDNRSKFTNIGNPYYNRLCIILIPLP